MASSLRRACATSSRLSAPSSSSLPSLAASSSRSFSSSPTSFGHIGKAPINYPGSVKLVSTPDSNLILTGPLGTQTVFIHDFVRLFHTPPATENDDGRIEVAVDDQTKTFHKNMWGTTRTLINNAIEGITEGYRIPIKMVGVGYRGGMEDVPVPIGRDAKDFVGRKRLNLKLGMSHPVLIDIPEGITVEVPLPTKFMLSGTDKQQVFAFAAQIRKWRPPEPYRGKVSTSIYISGVSVWSFEWQMDDG